MEKQVKQLFIFISVFLFISILGMTYAFFNYTRTGQVNSLVTGQIYFNYSEGNTISLLNEFPSSKEEARAKNNNFITFQVTGKNESSSDIYYKIILSYGEAIGDIRISDELLRFDLIEVEDNNTEKYLLFNESFSTLNGTVLLNRRIDANTSSTVTRTYKLRMWFSDDIKISDTNQNVHYTSSEWEKVYASIKVGVIGNTEDVHYFDSLGDALDAINNEDYHSSLKRSDAKLGIYIDSYDNTTNLVFYDNVIIDSEYTITKPVNINLYGYSLIDTTSSTIDYLEMIFDADVSIENGIIASEYMNILHGFCLTFNNINAVINNIDIKYESNNGDFYSEIYANNTINLDIKNTHLINGTIFSFNGSHVQVTNVTIDCYDELGIVSRGGFLDVYDTSINSWGQERLDMVRIINSESRVTLTDTIITCNDPSFAVINYGHLTVTNTRIFADSPGCYISSDNYAEESMGIFNSGTLIFNSGYVFGTHSAVQLNDGSKTYVYGGTFESTDHGGFYFAQGPTGIAYIENANINGINYPTAGRFRENGKESNIEIDGVSYRLEEARAAFYIGGNTNQNGENVYLVNCNISSESAYEYIVMRKSTPEQNLYLSGCTFINNSVKRFRVDKVETMRIYNGVGNNYGYISSIYNIGTIIDFETARNEGILIDTYTDYRGILSPE